MKTQLCLGTAQFGMGYGITNKRGKITEKEVAKILEKAEGSEIHWLDTAQGYGNAEEMLGRQLSIDNNFKLISKLTTQHREEIKKEHVNEWNDALHKSCKRLGVERLDALLLHNAADLKRAGNEYLEDWLLDLRDKEIVQRIGLSIYGKEDLDDVNTAILDMVQLPLSVLDQRATKDGTIKQLQSDGIAIHTRSVYLQGLLLTPARNWPDWVSKEARERQRTLERAAERKGCKLIDLALGFAKEQQGIEAVVVGISSLEELCELLATWSKPSPWGPDEWQSLAVESRATIDPRLWPS